MIEMTAIRKVYSTGRMEVEALKGVNLTIGRNEYVSIVGPSGSGKSTLMNLIGCLDTPSTGTYLLSGENVAGLDRNQLAEVRNKKIGFVFQSFNLLPYASALENVALPLLFAGISDKKRNERAKEMLERVGLGDRIDHKPTELSGGQMQRVAIARALANNPAIILADEPTGNLDSATGEEILSLLREVHAEGNTLVVVTHDSGIGRGAERTLSIRDGRIERDSGGESA
jgi:putative ABC transport system ATP-binding protein